MTLVNRLTIKSIAHSKDDMDIFCLTDQVKIDTLIEETPTKYSITSKRIKD